MAEIAYTERHIEIKYRKSSGGERRRFNLEFPHLLGLTASFVLEVERFRGTWRAIRVLVDPEDEDLEADPEYLARDLAEVRWHISPANRRDREIPPVVAVWMREGLLIAAGLPDRFGGRHSPLAEQLANPDPSRPAYIWPEPSTWDAAEKTILPQASKYSGSVAIPWYTPQEWFRRPDVAAELNEEPTDEETLAFLMAEEYARFVRRVRTLLAFCRRKNIPAHVVLGDVDKALEYFEHRGLDPLNQLSWAEAASNVFDPMPDAFLEGTDLKPPPGPEQPEAVLYAFGHWPGYERADAVGALILQGGKEVGSLVVWPNPALPPQAAAEVAFGALMEGLAAVGVEEIRTVDEVLPFVLCPGCGELLLHFPDEDEDGSGLWLPDRPHVH